jgi:hypothetical protein
MPKTEWDSVVYDPSDDSTAYWVAWMVEDNNNGNGKPLKYRVFRDERNKTKGEPITDAMSRDEAYEYLRKLKLLIGGNYERRT